MAVTAVTENHEFEVNNNPKLHYTEQKNERRWRTFYCIISGFLQPVNGQTIQNGDLSKDTNR